MLKEQILSTKLTDNQIALFYLGQEGFLIKYQEKYLLFDAYLSDYVDKNCCTEAVTWIRNYAPPMDASELDFIDYVFCSHPHYDHADPVTLRGIHAVNPNAIYIVPHVLKDTLCSYGIESSHILCADADHAFTLDVVNALDALNALDTEDSQDSIHVMPVPAAHEQLRKCADGHYETLGYVVHLGSISVYHAGDCCIYSGLCERIRNVDIGLLPINGRDYYRLNDDIIGNMDSREAILLAKKAGLKLLIPMHFDLYDVNEVNPGYFVDCLYKINREQAFHMFSVGERFIFEK